MSYYDEEPVAAVDPALSFEDPAADYAYAEAMDDELLASEEEMLANPAPYEAEVAADPAAAEAGLEESGVISAEAENEFNADVAADERIEPVITGQDD
jgi:hypothetical protein